MPSTYFTRLQTYKYHTGGSLNLLKPKEILNGTLATKFWDDVSDATYKNNWETDYINVYSFALKPEEHQPSGTCNFSRIDNAVLHYSVESKTGTVTTPTLNVFAINYNVLRIMSGMGGLAYSN